MAEAKKILFVCLGNIVRSPLAENLFRQKVAKSGLAHKYSVDSAGTAAYHVGEAPDPRMRQVAAAHDLKYTGAGRQFSNQDFEEFDLILPMDSSNFTDLKQLAANEVQIAKIRLMRHFDPDLGNEKSVPDPYYGGIDGFEQVYQMLERSTNELLRQLESGEIKI